MQTSFWVVEMKQEAHLSCSKSWWWFGLCCSEREIEQEGTSQLQICMEASQDFAVPEILWRSTPAGNTHSITLVFGSLTSARCITEWCYNSHHEQGLLVQNSCCQRYNNNMCRSTNTIWLTVHMTKIGFQACNPLAC